ncbi:MAG TPA: hypothetical protein PKO38_09095, partial [Bacillota bacterium]|nr:hypothetical protein [Bacillota bacterium]
MKAPGNKEKASCRVEWKDLLAFCIALYQILAPQLLASNPFTGDSEGDGAGKDSFLKNLALTGSVLLAAQDTEGRPDLAWRAKNRAELLGREAEHTKA